MTGEEALNINEVLSPVRDCFHDDQILDPWQRDLETRYLDALRFADSYFLEGQCSQADINIHSTWLVLEQQNLATASELDGIIDPGLDSPSSPGFQKRLPRALIEKNQRVNVRRQSRSPQDRRGNSANHNTRSALS